MTQYLFSVVHDPADDERLAALSSDEIGALHAQVGAFNDKLTAAGHWVFGGGLMPLEQTNTVHAHVAETFVTDGPFSESKEYIGGFWIVEMPDHDTALAWAKEASAACTGPVEVRPFQAEPPVDPDATRKA